MILLRTTTCFLLVAFSLASCSGDTDGSAAASPSWDGTESEREMNALAIDAVEVSLGRLVQSVEASGRIRGTEDVRVVSEVEGTIRSTPFELGETINEGALLLEVDATLAALRLEEAQKQLESAEIDFAAVQRRVENGSAAQAELLRARIAVDGARTRQRAAEKEYQDHFIRAPITGRIVSREDGIGRGNYITRGSPVARIVNLETVELRIGLGEKEIGYIEAGMPATVRVAACGEQPVSGFVHAIAAGADPLTGSFTVVIRWENICPQLRSGMSAVATIAVPNDERVLLIPGSALDNDSAESFVWVINNGTTEKREVETGRRMGDRIEVLAGLEEGDIIAASALSSLTDGSRVNATVRGTTGDLL